MKSTPLFIRASSVHRRLAIAGSKSRINNLRPFLLACFLPVYFAIYFPWRLLWPFSISSLKGKLYTMTYLKVYNCEWYVLFVLDKVYDVNNLTGEVFSLSLCTPHFFLPFFYFVSLKVFLVFPSLQHLPALLKPQPRKKPLTSGASPISGLWSAVNDSKKQTVGETLKIKVATKVRYTSFPKRWDIFPNNALCSRSRDNYNVSSTSFKSYFTIC